VTGAGSGLGRALSLALAGRGFFVGVQDLRPDRAEETLRGVRDRGGRGRVFAFDVGDGMAWSRAASDVREAEGGLDLLVNNAGVAIAAPLLEVAPPDWDWILRANLHGPLAGCAAFVPAMKAAGFGHVVNVASVAGLVPTASMGPYCVTKYGVVAYTEALALELAGSGVGVTLVCPYFFKTRIAQDGRGDDRLRSVAQWLIDLSGWPPERVAEAVLRAVEKDRLYVLPQLEAKALWALRRLSPRLFLWGVRRIHALALRHAPGPPPPGAIA
jgi:NAD(P)-dependent dehydrogenase (short-subunit alcohol dehydrogenase family)